jgi:competence protein ComEC
MARRIDTVLVLGVALSAGTLASAAPAWGAAALAVGLLCLARRRRALAAVALACAAFGAVRAGALVARFESARAGVVEAGGWPARCSIDGVVASSPIRVSGHARLEVVAKASECDGVASAPPGATVTVHLPEGAADDDEPRRGDRVRVVGTFAPPQRFIVDDLPDPRPAQARRGVLLSGGGELEVLSRARSISSLVDAERARVRVRIERTFSPEAAPMARAIVLGESDLTGDDDRAFRESGLAHLLAVSGAHLVVVVWGLVKALRAVLSRVERVAAGAFGAERAASAAGVLLAWVYADFAGGSGSAVRAAWMTSAALLATVLDRRPVAVRALGVSVLAGVLADPLAPFDVSFLLSVLATAGLLAWSSPWADAIRARCPRALSPVAGPVAASTAATVACAPLLLRLGPSLPWIGILANVLAVPVGELIALPLCLAHGVLTPLPLAERGAAVAASGALVVVRGIARVASSPRLGVLTLPPPTPGQLAVLGAGAFVHWLEARRRVLVAAVALVVALELLARRAGAPTGRLRVTFLDVGQGDAALVDLPDGSALLVDGGGLVGSPIDTGDRVIAPVLRARRRAEVARAMLSHPHPDHYLGLVKGLAAVRVGELWDTGQGEAEGTAGAYAELLTTLRGRGARVLGPGDVCGARDVGGAIVEVLAPCPAHDAMRGANDNSFVVRVRYGARAILFVGDAEHEAEATLLRTSAQSLRADVLKVGHHGSRTSTTAPFVAAVRPSVAVLSVGVRNRFGHPHPRTVATLASAGVRALRTDRDGAITVETDGRSLSVRAAMR